MDTELAQNQIKSVGQQLQYPIDYNTQRIIEEYLNSRSTGSVPAGAITMFGGETSPTGWLLCDGTSYLRADYPNLYQALFPINFGGDADNFNVPDMRGRFPVGLAASGTFNDLNLDGGTETVTLNASQIPAHSHIQRISTGGAVGSGVQGATNSSGDTNSLSSTASAGDGQAHNNLPPYRVVNFIIKT